MENVWLLFTAEISQTLMRQNFIFFLLSHSEWDGMIKELLDQRADVAIADLTITYNREQVVDFTMPFMNLGISVLYRKAIKQPPNLFSFLSPLSLDVWCYMAVSAS
jgi:glutamate receptor, ionotropic, invertebrate